MCGINGYTGFSGKDAALEAVRKMNDCLKHRGPDNQGTWHNEHVALGHARLSILDLSESANQPFVSDDGNYIIVFNGEIYNFHDIKSNLQKQVQGLNFRTSSDTEILMQAYIHLGEKCLEDLNGMFAFAIWDRKNQKLFIARDRLGKKPLYYYHKDETFLFSSELRSLLASGKVPRKLNVPVLSDYVQYQTVHAPHTLVSEVYMLGAGCFLTVENGLVVERPYWKPVIKEVKDTRAIVVQHIRELFEDAVRLRMIADVEVGAFLSGGIDSSAVVAQMSRLSKKPVNTFSIIFGEADFSEEKFSNQIAKIYNTNHHPIRIAADDFLHDIPAILKATDFPGGDGPNTYAVAGATRKTGIKVTLSGLGGDELFAGYPVFTQLYGFHLKKWLKKSPYALRKPLGAVAGSIKKGSAGAKLKRILQSRELNNGVFYSHSRQLFDKKFVHELIQAEYKDHFPVESLAKEIFGHGHSEHILSQVSIAELTTYMQNVLLRDTDQMTMAHALEVRAPFLDYRLVEYALGVNDAMKYPHTPKQLFTDAMGDLIPQEVIHRKKMGFTFPWTHWMRNEMRSYCETRIHNLAKRDCFNGKALQNLWQRFLKNDPSIAWSRVWHLVVLEEWLTNNHFE